MKKREFLKLILAVGTIGLLLTGCGWEGRESALEKSAVPVVTDIIKDNSGTAKCLKVKITQKVDDKHYKAIATLDNGRDLKIMIKDLDKQILVTIPVNQN